MILGALGAMNIGVQSIVARRYGEGRKLRAGQVMDNGILIGLLVGALCSGGFAVLAGDLFYLATNDPVVAEAGRGYVFYRILSGLPFLVMMAHRGFFNGIGLTRLDMKVAILSNVLNVFLNYLLIFGSWGFPRMECSGAALATTLANCVGMIYFICLALRPTRRQPYKYYRTRNIQGSVILGIVNLSVPSGTQVALTMLGFSVFSAIVARIGTIELAATNVVLTIMSLSFLPGAGIGVAAASLVSQKMGEGDPQGAADYGWESVRLGIVVMGSLGLVFISIPELILQVFTNDQAVIAAGILPLRIVGFVQAFDAAGMVLSQALQGAGLNRWVMFAEIVVNWGFFIPGTIISTFVLGWGMIGALLVLSLYLMLFGIAVTFKFAAGSWKRVKV
jgi:putative MATE family efflux protein